MMNSNSVLCADIGTTSLKAALVSNDGTVLAFSKQDFAMTNTSRIADEWLNAIVLAVYAMDRDMSSISAICVSGNGPTIVSEDGTTLLWNEKVPQAKLPDSCKKSLFLPRLEAFRKIFPEQWNASTYIFSGPEYVIYKMTENAYTILPEIRYMNAYWTVEGLKALSIPYAKLPPFASAGFRAGMLTPSMTKRLNLPESVPVFCGGPDFTVAMIGTNTLECGKICDCAGSSEGINLCTPSAYREEGVRTLPSVMPDLWNAAVLKESSGKKFLSYKKNIEAERGKKISYSDLIDECFENQDCEGYKILEEIADFVSCGVCTLKLAAKKQNIDVSEMMIATGGQAKNDKWMQLKSNRSKMMIGVTNCADAELIGDAILARVGLGEYHSIKDAANVMVKVEKIFYPANN